jgi:hypothetical protein
MNTISSNFLCSSELSERIPPKQVNQNDFDDFELFQNQIPNKTPPPNVYTNPQMEYSPETVMANVSNLRKEVERENQNTQSIIIDTIKNTISPILNKFMEVCCKDNKQQVLKPHLQQSTISKHPSFFIVDPEGSPTTYSISGVERNTVNTLGPSTDSSGSIGTEADVMATALSNGVIDDTLFDLNNSPLLSDIDPSIIDIDKRIDKEEIIMKDIPTNKGDSIAKEPSSVSGSVSRPEGERGIFGDLLGKMDDSAKNTPIKNIPKASNSDDLSRSKATIKPGQADLQKKVTNQPKPQADIPRINKANMNKNK